MRRVNGTYSFLQRMGALLLAAVMVFGLIPTTTVAADDNMLRLVGQTNTVSDPATHNRLDGFYGQSTLNAGKITVDKSVSDSAVTLNYGASSHTFTPGDDNFIVTVSQAAQVMGLASESSVPLDVVFILDTSGSMDDDNRAENMVTAANDAISTLMSANEHNRVAVVAFSSNDRGGVCSEGAAANVLSSLAHYTGDAATNHLQWVTDKGATTGENRRNIAGRDTMTVTIEGEYWWEDDEEVTVNAYRRGYYGGTNIQAGIIAGAKLLTADSTTTTVTTESGVVTRMPFIVILSDGQPTYSIDNATWYDPTSTTQQGDGNNDFAGNGFLPALVAAYYKAKITEKYYGTNASEDNRCSIYTIGVQLNEDLAEMTLDPSEHFVAGSGNDYYSSFNTYWTNFSRATPQNFNISVNDDDNFRITADSIRAARDAVNGKSSTGVAMYEGGLQYNDDHFAADDTDDIAKAFREVVTSIQKKAMSSPTRVDATFGADFSGYVTFTDPIGEYMEVKQMYGIVANGKWYRGQTFAQYMQNWSSAPQSFRDSFIKVLEQRCKLSGANVDVNELINNVVASPNQAYYNNSGYDNSIVWWGNGFTAEGEEDEQVQILGYADNDTIEYITDPNTDIPEGADYVCRSYFYYGTAGDPNVTPDEEFLYFVVRVQRSLTAPYQETVVVSAPASLLSVEQVMITESVNADGEREYTAAVTPAEPAHVVYEVGLRGDINPFNVDQIVGEDTVYVDETAKIDGETRYTNYANGVYTFYTNDWNRNEPEGSHHRAAATATFDAAADNSFYTYQEDTLIYVKQGESYVSYTGTTKPSGNGYYYAREYYEWSGNADQNGNYAAEKKTAYIAVDIPANAEVNNTDGQWYIPKGLYKASSLTGGENVYKDDPATTDVWNDGNFTETSDVVSHPHRTDTVTNSHYTVVLGNNGKLTLRSEKTKSVDINADEPTGIINADGQAVMVGDELTYTIKVINGGDVTANAEATDTIPAGTKYVDGSASHGGVYDETTGIIKWELKDIAAGDYVEVSFKVVVTEAAISGSNDVVNIDNTAYVKLDNQYGYETNTTTNPPEGKKVVDTEGKPIQGSVSIPQVLVYRIQWHNDAVDANGMPAEATVTVTDIIPEGTSYVTDSASHNGVYNAKDKTMTWTFKAAPGASGVVSFRVNVNAAAGETIQNGASIQVNNNPRVTNKTEVKVLHGNLILSKEVETNGFTAAENQEFTLNIVEIGRGMNGTYKLVKNGNAVAEGITFVNGVATVTIKHGDVLEIEDIPVGATISVTEQAKPGFTPAYYVNGSTEANKAEGRVTIAQGENKVDVTNTYDPLGVTFHIEGKKQLETSFDVEDTVFGFVANPVDVNGDEIADAAHLTGEVTVSSEDGKKEATISFSPVSFTTPGTYYYLISEINGGLGGVTYADEQYLVTITVTDDGSGQLKAEPEISVREGTSGAFADASGIVFVNSYAPQETQLTLAGKKVLNGRTLQDNEFSFIVTDSADKIAATGYNKGGEIIFTPITYTAPGTYTYTITEVNGGAHGMQYSEDKYTVTVTVEDVDGKLVAKENYTNLAAGETVPTFTNTYTPDGISVVLEAEKKLVGRGLKANEFNFVVKDSLDNTVATGMNDADGKIVFSPIGYTVDDAGKTFTYTVSEVIPDLARDPYMSYDQTEFNVEITVSYDNVQGKLSANVTYPAAGIKFINTQHPSSIDVFPQASKTTLDTTGNTTHVPGDATFSFVVVNVKNGEEAAVGVGPANDKVTFSSLTFTQAGEYLYWIKESHGEHKAHGITYDPTVYLMKVVVTHDDGKLDFTTTYYTMRDGGQADIAADYTVAVPAGTVPTFKNTYDAQGHIAITAKKVLNELVLKDGDFAFRLVREGVTDAGITGVVTISDVVKDGDDVLYSTGDVKFATLYFDLGEFAGSETTKTIHYVMSEIEPPVAKIPGVTYDKTAYDVYITIEHKNDGTIDAWVSDANGNRLTDANGNLLAANDSNVTFTNTYAPQQGTSATISGTKTLIGRTLKAGEFAFQLIHVENGTETLVDTVANAADGTFSFTRNYPATILDSADSRVIKYFVREVNSHLGGVKYDTNAFAAVVTIVDNKAEGRLEATTAYYALKENGDPANIEDYTVDLGNDVPTFANTYTVKETTYAPVVKKTLNNRDLTAGEFSFIITDGSGNVVSTGTNEAALAGEQANIIFSPIGFDKATTAGAEPIYTVTEVKGSLPGMGYDDTVFYLKVTVVDNGDGTLTPTGAFFTDEACTKPIDGQAPEFVNTYTPANVSLQLEADKILTGRDMEAGEFSFVVLDEHNKVVATGGNAAAAAGATADVIFSHIGYSLADVGNTYTYTIKELSTGQGGVTFHGNAFYAKVKITNDQAAGKLVPSVEYFSDIECNTKQDNIIFGNNYAPTDATLKLPVDKTLINKVLEADEFTFNLYQTGSDFKILGNPIQSTTNDEHGVVDFTALSFNRPGKYYYVVSEAVTDGDPDKLYTLDDPFQVIVTVTDNLKGQLVATAEYFVNYTEGGENTNLGGIEFINYYTAPALTVPLSTQIGAKKTVNTPNGITYSPEGFRFSITDVTGSIIKGFAQDENGNWVQVDMIGTSDADGNITFPNFRFATAGAYRYRLQEMDSNKGGIAEDGRVWEIHILVRYNETTGLLYVADSDVQTYLISDNGSAASKPAFVNTYTAEPTKLYLTASKKLTGIRELKDREFTLYLMERDPMGRDIIVASGYNDVNGNVRFEVPYTEVGTHFYSVKEYIPREGHGGVTYDETVYASLTVDVRDNGEGQLVAYVGGKAVSNGATITTGVTVTNRYDAKEAAAVILAHKAMLGDRPLNEGEFTFELVDSEGEVIATAVNNHDGHVEFVLDGYKTPGEYTYTLREKKGSLGGVTYDPTNHIVTVIVVDDGVGQLHASVAYNTEDGHAPIFTNSYKAAAVQAEIKAHKTLSGEKPLAAEKYTFELVDSEGNIITATNNAAGDVVFTLDYEEVGEHTYTLREKKGDEPGTTYDDTVYTVHVKVADNLNGKLVATVVYKDVEAGKVPGFINVYKGAEVPVLITAQKKLEGRALKADEFTFVLVNTKNEKETYTATNDANGNVGFNLTFKDSGVYTYTLYEKTGTDGYITYDDASYTVTVTVTDGLDGYMKAEVAYGTTDGSAPVFENVHTPGAVNVVLEGTKTLTGADLADYVFEFQVRDSDNKVVAEGKNDAKGNITFAGIGLNKAGTYTYTVTERNTGVKNVSYDTASFTVKVEVTDENGVLKAKVIYPEGGIKFANEYKQPDPGAIQVVLEGKKTMIGAKLGDCVFEFQVRDSEKNVVAEGKNDAKGNLVFDAITFDKAGTYTYTVTERNTAMKYVKYDTTSFTVKVEVTEEDGELKAKVTYPDGEIEFKNEYKKPDPGSPDTGDRFPLVPVLIVMALSGVLLIVLLLPRKKKGAYQK